MKIAIRQTLLLWAGLLLVSGLALLLLRTPTARAWMWQQTGEETFLAQIKGVSDRASDGLRPRLDLAPDAEIAHAASSNGVNPLGVNVFLEQEVDPAKRALAVEMAANAGFHWLRQEFPWEDIEIHGKGDFEDRRHEPARSAWAKYDQIVELAEQHDLELIVRLSNPPAWSRAGEDSPANSKAPPDDYQDYADFVSAVVERYRGRIRYYQLWNEPNCCNEWGTAPIDPEGYVALLKAGAEAARAADSDVVIIAAALSATIDLRPDNPAGANTFSDALFLQRMYNAGAAPYFDIMAVQGYGLWSGPTDRRMNPRVLNIARHEFIRDLMVNNGDADKPIWISEMNWNAVPDDVNADFGRVTEAQQARYLPLAFERIEEEWPWIGVANVWFLKRATNEWKETGNPAGWFTLLEADFTPLPVYEAMVEYAGE